MTRTISQSDLTTQPVPLNVGALLPTQVGIASMPIFDFATRLKLTGYDVGPAYAKAADILTALDSSRAPTMLDNMVLDALGDVIDLDPQDAAALIRSIKLNHLASGLGNFDDALRRRLDQSFGKAFREHGDKMITDVQPKFDAALADIVAANEAGMTPTTRGDQILDEGTPEQVLAYRRVGPVVALLDQIARLRLELCNVANVGPAAKPIACLVDAATGTELAGAANVYSGTTETVMVESVHPAAMPYPRKVVTARLGGPWLALVAAGYTLRLGTAAEADAVASRKD